MEDKKQATAATKDTAKKAAPVKKAQEPLMYVGPTIPGIATQNVVYTEIPAGAQAAFKNIPEMKNLFIPVLDYPLSDRMLREKKGYVFSAFNKALTLKGGTKA